MRLADVDRPTARRYANAHPRSAVVVRNMFSDALDDGLVDAKPFANLQLEQARGRSQHPTITEEELHDLAECALTVLGSAYGQLYRSFILATGYIGCRLNEGINLEHRDLRPREREVDLRVTRFSKPRTVLADALEQLPREVAETETIVLRTDSAGLTHELLDFCRDGNLRFSVGFDLTEPVRAAILALPETAWTAALDADGEPRTNGRVAELTEHLDLGGWPEGARVIARRERPHPGAQLAFTDVDGHRFQTILTDQPDADIAALERRHRARARVEDRIRAAKDCGLENLPFRDFDANAVWVELVLIAQDLLYWTQTLALTGELARSEPKKLRYRLLHTAGRLAYHARQAVLRLPRTWPWAGELAAAFARLAALPAR